uniref:Gem (nuclear organelle) associated protein 5 n=1 Tax=Neogobius melanostomus TaxID=47308 RepID=A0A8C6WLS4_9GOBI
MHERCLPAAPNWYCSRCSDVSGAGLFGFGAKNIIYLIQVSASTCRVVGELVGHRDLVSSFCFCPHTEQSHICVSSSCDGTVRFWDTETKGLLKEITTHQNPVSAVHWSPVDKNLVVSGDEKGVIVCHWFNTGDSSSFFPEPRTVFCLSCSPHAWNHVAVGYKDGMIVLVDVSKKGEVLHRLRGHDDEIHSVSWSTEPGESALCSRAEESEEGCFLASGSRDQTVRIWSTARGKAVMTLKLPYLKKRGSAVDPGVKERLWLNVHWPRGRGAQLISSCFSGELLLWDLLRSGKPKWTLFGSSSDAQGHNRIIFNTSSFVTSGQSLLLSTSMDREVKCWDMSSLELCWTLPALGGFVYCLSFSPLGSGTLALGVGDNMIRVWNTQSSNHYDTRSFWQGIKSKVTGITASIFIPQISSSYHKKTIYTLAWGPPVPPLSFGSSKGKPAYSLYSCAGEGTILQHDPYQLNSEAFNIDKLIKNSNNIQHKLSPHTDLNWKPDGKVVAIGNEDGCIDVYEAPSLRLLCSIQQHHKIINTLRWHHGLSPELGCLLASGSSNAIVYVHDLKHVLECPGDSAVVITEPFRRLSGHTAKITGLSWSHHHDDRLVTVCYDGTAQVWDVLQEAPVCNYRGHHGNLLCVDWSPVDPDVVWTGGKDFTVHEWRVSRQEFDKPPKGMEENGGSQGKKKKTKAKKSSVTSSLKKKKPRSMLPLSTSMDHRPKDELLQDCVTLASVTHNGCIPGQGDHIHLGLFSDREALRRMFEAEEEGHLDAGHFESVVYLRLWSGDLQGALQLATERGELNDHLLSLAPMAGFSVWSGAVDAYVKQLCLQEQFLKAASHLLSLNKLHDAIDLLRSHKLYREAIVLVKARLPQDEPVLKELYQSWAAVLEKDGHFSAAAKCYLAAGSSFDAAKVVSRKNEASSLRAAAELARVSGETALSQSLSLRCAKELALSHDWSAAQDVLRTHDALLVHRLHFSLAELLSQFLSDAGVIPAAPGVCSGVWRSANGPIAFQERVERVWGEKFGVSRSSGGHCSVKTLLQELKSVENPQPTANVQLKQVLLSVSLHLTRAFLSFLSEEEVQTMEELWRAVSWVKDTGHFSVFSELCHLLFPDGTTLAALQNSSAPLSAAALSLQSFVHYLRLYERWWSFPVLNENGVTQNGTEQTDTEEHPDETAPDLGFDATILLCESTAAVQATQRAMNEIQDKLSVMVTKHRAQEQESEEQNGDTTHEQDTALTVACSFCPQSFPRPDVLECCLLLLHFGRSSPAVSDAVKRQSKDLLQQFGTTSRHQKVTQKFIIT